MDRRTYEETLAKMQKKIDMLNNALKIQESAQLEFRKAHALECEEHYNVGQVVHYDPSLPPSSTLPDKKILDVFVDNRYGHIMYMLEYKEKTGNTFASSISHEWLENDIKLGVVVSVL